MYPKPILSFSNLWSSSRLHIPSELKYKRDIMKYGTYVVTAFIPLPPLVGECFFSTLLLVGGCFSTPPLVGGCFSTPPLVGGCLCLSTPPVVHQLALRLNITQIHINCNTMKLTRLCTNSKARCLNLISTNAWTTVDHLGVKLFYHWFNCLPFWFPGKGQRVSNC